MLKGASSETKLGVQTLKSLFAQHGKPCLLLDVVGFLKLCSHNVIVNFRVPKDSSGRLGNLRKH